jgi:hypothetical protein
MHLEDSIFCWVGVLYDRTRYGVYWYFVPSNAICDGIGEIGLNLVCSACRFLSETTIRLRSWFSGLSIENFDCLSEFAKLSG